MSSFFAESLTFISDRPNTVCAFVTSSRQLFNSSIIPVTVNFEKLWHTLGTISGPCNKNGTQTLIHKQLLSVFQHSDTLQFSPSLRLRHSSSHLFDSEFLNALFEGLLAKKYFSRTLKHLSVEFSFATLERVFKEGVSLESFSATDYNLKLNDADLGIVSAATGLRSFSVENASEIMGLGLARLAENLHHRLESLILPYASRIERGDFVKSLPKLQSLTTLTISNSDVNDEVVKSAIPQSLNKIRNLSFRNCAGVTDEGVALIAKLPELQRLDLIGCTITDTSLKSLASSWSSDDDITDAHVSHQLPLRSLKLSSSIAADNDGFAHLGRIGTLKELELNNVQLTDNALSAIARMKCLTSLTLNSTSYIGTSGNGLELLTAENGSLLHLRTLQTLYHTVMKSAEIASLKKLPSLETLIIYNAASLDDETVVQFPQFPSLAHLVVDFNHEVTFQPLLKSLLQCNKLTNLRIERFSCLRNKKDLWKLQKALLPKMYTVVNVDWLRVSTMEW